MLLLMQKESCVHFLSYLSLFDQMQDKRFNEGEKKSICTLKAPKLYSIFPSGLFRLLLMYLHGVGFVVLFCLVT